MTCTAAVYLKFSKSFIIKLGFLLFSILIEVVTVRAQTDDKAALNQGLAISAGDAQAAVMQ